MGPQTATAATSAIGQPLPTQELALQERAKTAQIYKPDADAVNEFVKKQQERWGAHSGSQFEENGPRIQAMSSATGYTDENPEHVTTFKHACPNCKTPLKIVSDTSGTVISVEHALEVQHR